MNTSKYKLPKNPDEHLLFKWLSNLLAYLEEAIRLDEEAQPRCSCCGSTKNLQSGWAGGVLSWRCPGAASEDMARGW